MNDSEMLVWIAEHLLYFRPGLGVSTMTYIDDTGTTHEVEYNTNDINAPCVDLLKACVSKARTK